MGFYKEVMSELGSSEFSAAAFRHAGFDQASECQIEFEWDHHQVSCAMRSNHKVREILSTRPLSKLDPSLDKGLETQLDLNADLKLDLNVELEMNRKSRYGVVVGNDLDAELGEIDDSDFDFGHTAKSRRDLWEDTRSKFFERDIFTLDLFGSAIDGDAQFVKGF